MLALNVLFENRSHTVTIENNYQITTSSGRLQGVIVDKKS